MRIWGIAKPLEELTKEELQEQIDSRVLWINQINKDLPYADFGAYGQDMQRISEYREEIRILKTFLS